MVVTFALYNSVYEDSIGTVVQAALQNQVPLQGIDGCNAVREGIFSSPPIKMVEEYREFLGDLATTLVGRYSLLRKCSQC